MSSHNGSSNGQVAPDEFPPPVDSQREFVKRGLDAEDELIEVAARPAWPAPTGCCSCWPTIPRRWSGWAKSPWP